MTTTPLTPEAEELYEYADQLARAGHLDRFNVQEGIAMRLDAYTAAVTARVLADVAARLPEALKAAAQEMYGDTYDRQWLEAFAPFLAAHLTGGTDR